MKNILVYSISFLLLMVGCAEDDSIGGNEGNIVFRVSEEFQELMTRNGASCVQSVFPVETDIDTEEPLFVFSTVENGISKSEHSNATRGAKVEDATSLSFGVSEYTSTNEEVSNFQNVAPFYNSTAQLYNSGRAWEEAAFDSPAPTYKFYAYAPYLSTTVNGLTLSDDKRSIYYNASGVTVANQQDLMTAYASSTYTPTGIPLVFEHRLCAIRLVLGSWVSGYTISSVRFTSIISSGTVSLDNGSWEKGSTGEYIVSGITGANSTGYNVTGIGNTEASALYLMMVPQTVSTDMIITLTDANSQVHTLTANVSGTWDAGKTVTYTITPQGITSMTATYPTGWGGEIGPVTQFESGESFGLFAINPSTNQVVMSNVEVSVSSDGTSLVLPSGKIYSAQHRYFLYYPYQSSLTGAPALGATNSSTTADAFFSSVITAWTPVTDQSNNTVFKEQDLQVSMASGSGASLSFAMVHKMGLIKVNMPSSTDVPKLILYTVNQSNTKYTSGSVTAYGLNKFSTSDDGVIPWNSNRIASYYIAKPESTYKFVTPNFTEDGIKRTVVEVGDKRR